jgi:hypothetical protein
LGGGGGGGDLEKNLEKRINVRVLLKTWILGASCHVIFSLLVRMRKKGYNKNPKAFPFPFIAPGKNVCDVQNQKQLKTLSKLMQR